MTRRVFVALVGITTLAVVLFAVPLGIVLAKIYRDQQVLVLQREATAAAIRIPDDRRAGDPIVLPKAPADGELGYYEPSGHLAAGTGPADADPVTANALLGTSGDANDSAVVVGAVPVSDDLHLIGAVRITEPDSVVADAVRLAWTRLLLLSIVVIAVAAVVAIGLARRLARPWQSLERRARKLGDGDFTSTSETTGIDEIDRASRALDDTAGRLAALIERERRFSADASHQLRTPLTGLQIVLEAELARPRDDPSIALRAALFEAERLDATVDSLLSAARDDPRQRHPIDIAVLVSEAAERHRASVADAHRGITSSAARDLPRPTVSKTVVNHVIDVLLENAVRHGRGDIIVNAEDVAGVGVSVTVTDHGPRIGHAETLFQRRSPSAVDHGIGLALAVDLAAAEGGSLRLKANTDSTTAFELLLPVNDDLP